MDSVPSFEQELFAFALQTLHLSMLQLQAMNVVLLVDLSYTDLTSASFCGDDECDEVAGFSESLGLNAPATASAILVNATTKSFDWLVLNIGTLGGRSIEV